MIMEAFSFVINKTDNEGFVVWGYDDDISLASDPSFTTINVAGNFEGLMEVLAEQAKKLMKEKSDVPS